MLTVEWPIVEGQSVPHCLLDFADLQIRERDADDEELVPPWDTQSNLSISPSDGVGLNVASPLLAQEGLKRQTVTGYALLSHEGKAVQVDKARQSGLVTLMADEKGGHSFIEAKGTSSFLQRLHEGAQEREFCFWFTI